MLHTMKAGEGFFGVLRKLQFMGAWSFLPSQQEGVGGEDAAATAFTTCAELPFVVFFMWWCRLYGENSTTLFYVAPSFYPDNPALMWSTCRCRP